MKQGSHGRQQVQKTIFSGDSSSIQLRDFESNSLKISACQSWRHLTYLCRRVVGGMQPGSIVADSVQAENQLRQLEQPRLGMTNQRNPLAQLDGSQQHKHNSQSGSSASPKEPGCRVYQRAVAHAEDSTALPGPSGTGAVPARQQNRSPPAGLQPTPPYSHSRPAGAAGTPLPQTSLSLREAALAQASTGGNRTLTPLEAVGPLRETFSSLAPTESCDSPELPHEVSAASHRHQSALCSLSGNALRDSCPVTARAPRRLEAAHLRPIAKSGDWTPRNQPLPTLSIPVCGSLNAGGDRYGSPGVGCSQSPNTISAPFRSPSSSESPVCCPGKQILVV